MKTLRLIVLLITVIMVACSKNGNDPTPDDTTAGHKDEPTKEDIEAGHKPGTSISDFTAEWKADIGGAGGFNNPESYKNFQFEYEVEGNNQTITYSVSSNEIDVAFFLFNSNGERMWQSGSGRLAKGEKVLPAGKYRIAVMADRYAVGKFTLKIGGIIKNFTRLSFDILKSGERSWSQNGGGGFNVTPKNHFYSFEVTEDNTWVDIEMESKDTEIGLYLYDTNGEGIVSDGGRRRHNVIAKLRKGIYWIMAATGQRGARGNYVMNLFGKVKSLNLKAVSEKVIEGNFVNKQDLKEFTIEVTEDNSLIDFQVTSLTHAMDFALFDDNGQRNTYIDFNPNIVIVRNVQKRFYKIFLAPSSTNPNTSGNFKLIIVGNFK